jgi:hypothetical protein
VYQTAAQATMTAPAATAVRRHPTLDMGHSLATPGPGP